jgi:Aldehyde dehydrogenase family
MLSVSNKPFMLSVMAPFCLFIGDKEKKKFYNIGPRTAKEAIALANNTMYGLAASVHTEQLTLALETAKNIKVSESSNSFTSPPTVGVQKSQI